MLAEVVVHTQVKDIMEKSSDRQGQTVVQRSGGGQELLYWIEETLQWKLDWKENWNIFYLSILNKSHNFGKKKATAVARWTSRPTW